MRVYQSRFLPYRFLYSPSTRTTTAILQKHVTRDVRRSRRYPTYARYRKNIRPNIVDLSSLGSQESKSVTGHFSCVTGVLPLHPHDAKLSRRQSPVRWRAVRVFSTPELSLSLSLSFAGELVRAPGGNPPPSRFSLCAGCDGIVKPGRVWVVWRGKRGRETNPYQSEGLFHIYWSAFDVGWPGPFTSVPKGRIHF